MAAHPLLTVKDLHAFYGSSHVLQGVNLTLQEGAMSLVGRNGMGKTTLVKTIMGLVPAQEGIIRFKGDDVARLKPFQIAGRGIGYVPQGRLLFPSLSVKEHLVLAARRGNGAGWDVERVFALFPRLAERARQSGTALSGGEQQMLAIGRALVTNPNLLIMDEPSEGLAPVILDHLIEIYHSLVKSGVSILMVEQNLRTATALSEELYVMISGQIVDKVKGELLLSNQAMREQYLGVKSDVDRKKDDPRRKT
jgi:branched-chain amino acid transport system ATP-binding protein